MAKQILTLFILETKKSKTTSDKIDIGKSEYANLIDAASQGKNMH